MEIKSRTDPKNHRSNVFANPPATIMPHTLFGERINSIKHNPLKKIDNISMPWGYSEAKLQAIPVLYTGIHDNPKKTGVR